MEPKKKNKGAGFRWAMAVTAGGNNEMRGPNSTPARQI